MTEVSVTDPEMVVRKTVDQSGRVYLGKDLADDEVEVIVTKQEDADDAENAASTPQEGSA